MAEVSKILDGYKRAYLSSMEAYLVLALFGSHFYLLFINVVEQSEVRGAYLDNPKEFLVVRSWGGLERPLDK